MPEAHAIYQFTLAPLVLHALQTGDAAPLARWATSLSSRPGTTALNFLASHDGVGVRPADGWLTPAARAALAARCVECGGRVNEAETPDGREPYELAATWRSLCEVGVGAPYSDDELAARIVAGHSVAFALAGIPLLYVHSAAGTTNAHDLAHASGVTRDLNRRRFGSPDVYLRTLESDPIARRVWPRLREMLEWRAACAAFHPEAPQQILDAPPGVLAVRRGTDDDGALVLTNLASRSRTMPVGPGWTASADGRADGDVTDGAVELGPWGTRWLRSV